MGLPAQHPEYPTVNHCVGGVTHFDDAPEWIYGLDNPYLHGVYAPVTQELSAEDSDDDATDSKTDSEEEDARRQHLCRL